MKNSNPRLAELREGDGDAMYHLGLISKEGGDDELREVFGDTAVIATMGSGLRAFRYADSVRRTFGKDASIRVMGEEPNRTFDAMSACKEQIERLEDLSGDALAIEFHQALERIQKVLARTLELPETVGKTERYWTFVVDTPVGGVICVNHHMGEPTHNILLEELTRLMHHVEADRQEYPFEVTRWGTSGGFFIPEGTVVVAERGLNPAGEPFHTSWRFGKQIKKPSEFTPEMNQRLMEAGEALDGDFVMSGDTVSCPTFHIAQGRVHDTSSYLGTEEEKMAYLRMLREKGAVNMEMEGKGLAAHCNHHGIPVGMACATVVDRGEGDQIRSSFGELVEYTDRPKALFLEYLQRMAEERTGWQRAA